MARLPSRRRQQSSSGGDNVDDDGGNHRPAESDDDETFREWRKKWRHTGKVVMFVIGAIGTVLLFLAEMYRIFRDFLP